MFVEDDGYKNKLCTKYLWRGHVFGGNKIGPETVFTELTFNDNETYVTELSDTPSYIA